MTRPPTRTKFQGPIQVTEYEETIIANGLNQYEESDVDLSVHGVCHGLVSLMLVSPSHKVLRCGNCNLRVYVPAEVVTLGDLRSHFTKKVRFVKD